MTTALPERPPRSRFAIASAVGAVVMTIITALTIGFNPVTFLSDLGRPNPVLEGLLNPDWSQITNERSREACAKLWSNAKYFREQMETAGFTCAGKDHAIIPPQRLERLLSRRL